MDITFDTINGLCFGIEYVPADHEAEIYENVIMVEFACFRWIIWLGEADDS